MPSLKDIYDLARPASDNGTLFQGDTQFKFESVTQNFSSSNCVCRVSKAQFTLSSHAGTHADTPAHFVQDEKLSFDTARYSGKAVFLNISHLMSNTQVTSQMLSAELGKLGKVDKIYFERVVLRTHKGEHYPSTAQESFAYLGQDVPDLLASLGTKVILIDSPSVDDVHQKDLAAASHGRLLRHGIAPVENIAPPNIASCSGEIRTIFDPLRVFVDAKGIAALLFAKS